MSPLLNNRPPRPQTMLRALLRVILFNSQGLSAIGNTNAAFLASLAPLLAFWLVGAGLDTAQAGPVAALRDFLPGLVVLLAQPVIVHWLATRFGRVERWRQYMTALNWSQLLLPLIVSIISSLAALAVPEFDTPEGFTALLLGVYGVYAFALQWFLTRKALGFPPGQAALFVFAVTVLLMLLVVPAIALRVYLAGGFAAAGITT